jgi:hypothetical protein
VCRASSNTYSLFHPIIYYDICQGIYVILPDNVFCPL